MILGVQWLRTLRDILWNFGQSQMKFQNQGAKHTLLGNPGRELRLVGRKKMVQLLGRSKQLAVLYLCALGGVEGP